MADVSNLRGMLIGAGPAASRGIIVRTDFQADFSTQGVTCSSILKSVKLFTTHIEIDILGQYLLPHQRQIEPGDEFWTGMTPSTWSFATAPRDFWHSLIHNLLSTGEDTNQS